MFAQGLQVPTEVDTETGAVRQLNGFADFVDALLSHTRREDANVENAATEQAEERAFYENCVAPGEHQVQRNKAILQSTEDWLHEQGCHVCHHKRDHDGYHYTITGPTG